MMRRASTVALLALLLLGPAADAGAEPRFAVREGMHCAHCHVNRTGGGMRNALGAVFAETNLATLPRAGVFDPRLGDDVTLGGNLRLELRTVLAARTRLEDLEREAKAVSSFEIPEGNLYVRADLVEDHLALYLDETVAPEGASAREAFLLIEGLPLGGWIKAGRFLLPYGLRILDDMAFIRQETGFTYANQDLGVEAGIWTHPFFLAVSATNGSLGGSDPNVAKQLTARAELVGGWMQGGLSVAWNDTSTDDFEFRSLTSGAHVGLRMGRATAHAALDWVTGMGAGETFHQAALYTATTFEAVRGLYLRFVFEAYDPLRSLANNERDRFVAGVSWFPTQLLELRAEARINRDIPQRVGANADELNLQLHAFF